MGALSLGETTVEAELRLSEPVTQCQTHNSLTFATARRNNTNAMASLRIVSLSSMVALREACWQATHVGQTIIQSHRVSAVEVLVVHWQFGVSAPSAAKEAQTLFERKARTARSTVDPALLGG